MSRPIALPTKLKRFRSERFSWLRLLLALLPILAGCAQHSSACSKGVSISGCGRASGGKCNECDAVKASSVGGRGEGEGRKQRLLVLMRERIDGTGRKMAGQLSRTNGKVTIYIYCTRIYQDLPA